VDAALNHSCFFFLYFFEKVPSFRKGFPLNFFACRCNLFAPTPLPFFAKRLEGYTTCAKRSLTRTTCNSHPATSQFELVTSSGVEMREHLFIVLSYSTFCLTKKYPKVKTYSTSLKLYYELLLRMLSRHA
jgi:hypothetical protein